MKFETPDLMGLLRRLGNGLAGDLRDKGLWPVAALLLVAIIAVPILLSSSAKSTPVAQASQGTPPPGTAMPAVDLKSGVVQSNLKGKGRNPFNQLTTTSTTSTASTPAPTTSTTGTTGGAPSSSGGASGGAPAPTSSGTAPTTIVPNAKPTTPPSGLSATESYDVSMAITNSAGALNTLNPLERLSLVPSDQQPLLVELGVLQGGHRVLFAVEPGTVVGGPGTCTPGPIDCEILSLGQDQTESVGTKLGSQETTVALFAVTGINATEHGSAAAATKAREKADEAGRQLLDSSKSKLPALSLFKYEPSLGAIVDLRNLTVGGS
jgi:hypothetical protein